ERRYFVVPIAVDAAIHSPKGDILQIITGLEQVSVEPSKIAVDIEDNVWHDFHPELTRLQRLARPPQLAGNGEPIVGPCIGMVKQNSRIVCKLAHAISILSDCRRPQERAQGTTPLAHAAHAEPNLDWKTLPPPEYDHPGMQTFRFRMSTPSGS